MDRYRSMVSQRVKEIILQQWSQYTGPRLCSHAHLDNLPPAARKRKNHHSKHYRHLPTTSRCMHLLSPRPQLVSNRVSSVHRRLKSCLDDRGLEINSGKIVAMLISPSRSRIPIIDFRINLFFYFFYFFTQVQTPVTLRGGELRSILVVRLAHSCWRLSEIWKANSLAWDHYRWLPSWPYHIDSVCRKVGRKIGALRRSFCLLSPRPHARRKNFISVIQ